MDDFYTDVLVLFSNSKNKCMQYQSAPLVFTWGPMDIGQRLTETKACLAVYYIIIDQDSIFLTFILHFKLSEMLFIIYVILTATLMSLV